MAEVAKDWIECAVAGLVNCSHSEGEGGNSKEYRKWAR